MCIMPLLLGRAVGPDMPMTGRNFVSRGGPQGAGSLTTQSAPSDGAVRSAILPSLARAVCSVAAQLANRLSAASGTDDAAGHAESGGLF